MMHKIAMCAAGHPTPCPCCAGSGRLEYRDENLAGAELVAVCTHCMGRGQVLSDAPRIGGWIQTYTGRAFFLMDARPEDFCIEDIASGLSMQTRYVGQGSRFYSIAEHSVLVAGHLPDDQKLCGLLHDGPEAYLGDLSSPLKKLLPDYCRIEHQLLCRLAERYRLAPPPWPAVKRIDTAIVADERAQLFGPPPLEWPQREPPLGVKLRFWTPARARAEFLAAFQQFGHR
jgi:5'-nucleotidase